MLGNNGKAMPNAPITRQEAMVMLARALGVAPVTDTKALAKFADADKAGTFAQGYLAALVEAGIVKGTAEGKLDPLSNITRAEMVTIVDRLIAHYADTDGIWMAHSPRLPRLPAARRTAASPWAVSPIR